MRNPRKWAITAGVGFFLLAPLVAGCASKGNQAADNESPEVGHMRQAAMLVMQYATATRKSPKSTEEIKDWVVKENKGSEDDLKSTRDGEFYGCMPGMMGGMMIVYEKTGKSGKVYRYRMGSADLITKEDMERETAGMKEMQDSFKKSMRGGPPN